jgi:hypothetical protein
MKPEKQQLIQDLLGDDDRREATLLAGARALRRRQHRRAATRGLAIALALVLSGVCFERVNSRRQSVRNTMSAAAASEPVKAHALTDDELLALFPNTPVGLATLADGKKRLIFPRPGDEQRFITRL